MFRLAALKQGYREITGSLNGIELNGKGRSTGIELLLRKIYRQWSGFLAYTLSGTTRHFENFNNGKEYPYEFDKPHSA